MSLVQIKWPNGKISFAEVDSLWLHAASEAGHSIPTGCLGGSCGACEIEVDGTIIRACITNIKDSNTDCINVDLVTDPYW